MLNGFCSQCHKVWTLDARQGLCEWCGRASSCVSSDTRALRSLKSRSRRKKRQAEAISYEHLDGEWLAYYQVASKFAHRARVDDRNDLLHEIMLTLARVERNNGDKGLTEPAMYRLASHTVAHYWYRFYKISQGLDCGHCSTEQRRKCRKDWLYGECPKAITVESLNKPVVNEDGEITELGELIADDKASDLDAWVSDRTWELGYPKRLVDIAHKLKAGTPLANADRIYLCRFRKAEQKRLFE